MPSMSEYSIGIELGGTRATKPAIEKATLGNGAGLYGAAYLPWE
jgi:hypothetical protein